MHIPGVYGIMWNNKYIHKEAKTKKYNSEVTTVRANTVKMLQTMEQKR